MSPTRTSAPLGTPTLPDKAESFDTDNSSRRHFLRQLTVGAGAAGLGLFSPGAWASETGAPSDAPLEPTSAPQEVIVIGAGLAGLAAAWELDEAGHEVTVLEAKSRPGGRVHTARDPFADGLYSETGAAAFGQTFTAAKRYVDALGLKTLEWGQPSTLYHLKGQRFSAAPEQKVGWPYELSEEERGLGPAGLMKKYLFSTLPEAIAKPKRWNQPPLSGLDEISLAEYLREQGASEGAAELLSDTQFFGGALEDTSTLSVALADLGLLFRGAPFFVLAGGNDRLPTGMARRLDQQVQYNVEVQAVHTTGDTVEVQGRRGSQPVRFHGTRAVVAVPAPAVQEIRFDPPLPGDAQSAVARLPYRDAVRVQFQIRRPFWRDEGVSGAASTDLFEGRLNRQPYSEIEGAGRRVVLEAIFDGHAAERLAPQPNDRIIERALRHLEQLHPQIRAFQEGALVKSWSRDPYALGGYSWPSPGDVTSHLKALQRPHGPVHFAGEHTSVLRATMEGALRSGVRAATEVNEA